MQRAHNFFAGPAILPVAVLEETRDAVMDFAGLGVSIMEISHRDKVFEKVVTEAQADALTLMGLPADEYSVVFLGGGATTQFALVPLNFLQKKADYVNTGEWASKAIKEAKTLGEVTEVASSKESKFTFIPKNIKYSNDADYVHITTNNTIYGTQWKTDPDTGSVPLVADMSSDILGIKRDFKKYSLVYAGAQKNIGPAGVVMVVIKKAWMEAKGKQNIPSIFKYKTHVDAGSLANTPPALPLFVPGTDIEMDHRQRRHRSNSHAERKESENFIRCHRCISGFLQRNCNGKRRPVMDERHVCPSVSGTGRKIYCRSEAEENARTERTSIRRRHACFYL